MNKNTIISILVVLVVTLSAFLFLNLRTGTRDIANQGLSEKSTELTGDRTLHVVSLDWKPFIYEENGVPKGIGAEIMDQALKDLDVNYDLTLVPWSRALKLTEAGDADAILAATHKEDREAYMAFTPAQLAYGRDGVIPESYLLKLDYVLFLKKSNVGKFNFESIEQLVSDRYTVGVTQDFSYTPQINAADFKRAVHFSEPDSFRALMNDEIDFFLASKEVGLETLNQMELSENITYVDTPVDSSYIFLVFSKSSKYPNLNELIEKFDEKLIQIYKGGKYDDIYSKYIQ